MRSATIRIRNREFINPLGAKLKVFTPAAPSLPSTVIEEMKEMSLRLGFSQAMVLKLVDDQEIGSPWTLASLSDEDIAAICIMIHRPGGLVSGKTPDRGNKISVLATKNVKLTVFMLKTMEHCSKDYKIRNINSTLCCTISTNGSWNRRKQITSRRPK